MSNNKHSSMDLSIAVDLSIGIMHLISLEEHLFFSMQKNPSEKYRELLKVIRKMRIHFMTKLLTNPQAEEWCISKHLLSASMRFMECGNKAAGKSDSDEYYDSAYILFTQFFHLNNLSIINEDSKESEKKSTLNSANGLVTQYSTLNTNIFISKAKQIFSKIVNCCIE